MFHSSYDHVLYTILKLKECSITENYLDSPEKSASCIKIIPNVRMVPK